MIDAISSASSLLAAYRQGKRPAATPAEPAEPVAAVGAGGLAPATGSTASAVAPETAGKLIEAGQGADEQDEVAGLPVAWRHYIEDIVADPAYAARQAELLGTSPRACMTRGDEMPKNGDPPEVWMACTRKIEQRAAVAKEAQETRYQIYKEGLAKGTPPAQLFAELLKSDVAGPAAQWNAIGAPGALDSVKAQLNYLQKLLGQAGA